MILRVADILDRRHDGRPHASLGDVIGDTCSTAKNRRLSLPSIGEDEA
jgi:hypothetical protein